MNEVELHQTLERVQALIKSETGQRLGVQAEALLGKIIRNVSSGNLAEAEGFTSGDVTILFADLRGFTAIAARHPADTVLRLVNRCLITMSEVVFRHRGTIDKFMGDAIMVLFADVKGSDDAVRRALHCAVDLQLAMDELNQHYVRLGLPEMYLGVGINTGPVLSGTMGSEFYAAFTVIGDDVNLAARIESYSLRGQVLASQSTCERCVGFVSASEPQSIHIKGKQDPIIIREIYGIPSHGKTVPRREFRKSPRVKVAVPFTYQVIDGDVLSPHVHTGTIRDVGYFGILAELDRACTERTDLKLELALAPIGQHIADAYGKVVKVARSGRSFICGIEFTSLSDESARNLRLFVQSLIQGVEPT
jgi:adenylate cyclase